MTLASFIKCLVAVFYIVWDRPWRNLLVSVGMGITLAVIVPLLLVGIPIANASPLGQEECNSPIELGDDKNIRVCDDGRIADELLIDGKEQLGFTTTIAITFNNHSADIGLQGVFTSVGGTDYENNPEDKSWYKQKVTTAYTSTSYWVTQTTFAGDEDWAVQQLVISKTDAVDLTGGRLLYLVDINAGEVTANDGQYYTDTLDSPAYHETVPPIVYQIGQATDNNWYATGMALLTGTKITHGMQDVTTIDIEGELKSPSIPPTIENGENLASWFVVEIPELTSNNVATLTFALCSQSNISRTVAENNLVKCFDKISEPKLVITTTAPATVPTVHSTVPYTFEVSHADDSDRTAVKIDAVQDFFNHSTITVTYFNDTVSLVSKNDGNTNNLLEWGETWMYTYTRKLSDDQQSVEAKGNNYCSPFSSKGTIHGKDKEANGLAQPGADHKLTFQPAFDIKIDGPIGSFYVGSPINFIYKITRNNAESDDLTTGITITKVTDNWGNATLLSGDDGDDLLEHDETWHFKRNYNIKIDDPPNAIHNRVTVYGQDSRDGDEICSKSAMWTVPITYKAKLLVEKTGPIYGGVGDSIPFIITVRYDDSESDGTPLTITEVIDERLNTLSNPDKQGGDTDNLLEPGEWWVYQANDTIAKTDPDEIQSMVTVTATNKNGETVNGYYTRQLAVYYDAGLELNSIGIPNPVPFGESFDLKYHLSLDNDKSSVTIDDISDTLPNNIDCFSGGCDGTTLADGNTWVYQVTPTITIAKEHIDPIRVTTTVTGQDQANKEVKTLKTYDIDISYAPRLVMSQTGVLKHEMLVGETVVFAYEVQHADDSDNSPVLLLVTDFTSSLSNTKISINRKNGGDDDDYLGEGEQWTFHVEYTAKATAPAVLQIQNSLTGRDRDQYPAIVPASFSHDVAINFDPGLKTELTGTSFVNSKGETGIFTFTIQFDETSKDQSNVTFNDLTNTLGISFTRITANVNNILEAGEVWVYTASHIISPTNGNTVDNEVAFLGFDKNNNPITKTSNLHTIYVGKIMPYLKTEKNDTITFTLKEERANLQSTVLLSNEDTGLSVTNVSVKPNFNDVTVVFDGCTGNKDKQLDIHGDRCRYIIVYTITLEELKKRGYPVQLVIDVLPQGKYEGIPVRQRGQSKQHIINIDYDPKLDLTLTSQTNNRKVGDVVNIFFTIKQDMRNDKTPVAMNQINANCDKNSDGENDGDMSNPKRSMLEVVKIDGEQRTETWLCEGKYTIQPTDKAPLTITEIIIGTTANGKLVTATGTLVIDQIEYNPKLKTEMKGPKKVVEGSTHVYTYVVKHADASDLSPAHGVTVTHNLSTPIHLVRCDTADGSLSGKNETCVFTSSHTIPDVPPIPEKIAIIVTATGTDQNNNPVSFVEDERDFPVISTRKILEFSLDMPSLTWVGEPAIPITITLTPYDRQFEYVTDITFDSNVEIPPFPPTITGDINHNGWLDNGSSRRTTAETWTHSFTYQIQPDDPYPFIITVTVTGEKDDGISFTEVVTKQVEVTYEPQLEIKASCTESAKTGDKVDYSFTLIHDPVNGDNSSVSQIVVIQTINGEDYRLIPVDKKNDNGDESLSGDEQWVYTNSYTIKSVNGQALNSSIVVRGFDKGGNYINEVTAECNTDLLGLTLEIQNKDGSKQFTAKTGDFVDYQAKIHYKADEADDDMPAWLTDITLNDGQIPTEDCVPGGDYLGKNETWTCPIQYTIPTTATDWFTHTVTVRGIHEGQLMTATVIYQVQICDESCQPPVKINIYGTENTDVGREGYYIYIVSHIGDKDSYPIQGVAITHSVFSPIVPFDECTELEALKNCAYFTMYPIPPDTLSPLTIGVTATGTIRESQVVQTATHATQLHHNPVLSATFEYLPNDLVRLLVKHDSTSDGSPVKDIQIEPNIGSIDNDQWLQLDETRIYTFSQPALPDKEELNAQETSFLTITGNSLSDEVITSSVRCLNCENKMVYLPILMVPPPQASLKIVYVEPTEPIKIGEPASYTFKVSYAEDSKDTLSDGIKVVDDQLGGQATCKDGNGQNVDSTRTLQKDETWTCTVEYAPQLTDLNLSPPIKPVMWESNATVSGNNAGADTVRYEVKVDFKPVLLVTVEPAGTSMGGEDIQNSLVLKVKIRHAPDSDFSPVNGVTIDPDWGSKGFSEGDDGDKYLEKDEEWIYLLNGSVDATRDINVVVRANTMEGDTDEITYKGSYEFLTCSIHDYDDFSDSNTGNWANLSNDRGIYTYENGKYKLIPARDDKNIRTAYHPGNDGERYSGYTAQVDCEWQKSNGSCGIIFDVKRGNMQSPQITSLELGYHFTVDINSTSLFNIQKVDSQVSPTWVDVSDWNWEQNLPTSFDTPITTLKVKCDETGTTLFVDDIKIASGNASCYGELGVISSGANRSMYYDNFEICGQQQGGEIPVGSKAREVIPD
ncbi:hypothetical protein QUF64_07000 [Anaerolineales bacterium HSG6]|nr:hypothetical protein [Anaerolineales bacterium HSG6]